jgi:hydrogenase maturation protease
MAVEREVLVLGIGNFLWADEGFGVRAVEALHQAFSFPAGVELMDGGTLGLSLLPYVETSRCVLVLDAIDYGLEPGTLKVLRDAEVPAWGARTMSPTTRTGSTTCSHSRSCMAARRSTSSRSACSRRPSTISAAA